MEITLKTITISRSKDEVLSESYKQVVAKHDLLDELAKALAETFLKRKEA